MRDDIQSLRTDEIQGRFIALDDMPLVSQWIKKSKSEDLDFLAVTNLLDAYLKTLTMEYTI